MLTVRILKASNVDVFIYEGKNRYEAFGKLEKNNRPELGKLYFI